MRMVGAFAILGLVLGLLILSHRNFYEDEWVTLNALHRPFGEMVHWSNTRDIHPPGVYALDHAVLRVTGSDRLIGVLHLLLWLAGVLVFVRAAAGFTATRFGLLVFTALAFLHPQALMWNSSLRWYPIWWGVALAMLAACLLHGRRQAPGWRIAIATGVGIALLIWFDYLALIFVPALGVAWLVRHGWNRASLTQLAGAGVTALLCALPQLLRVTGELLHSGHGHMTAPVMAGLRLGHALTVGGAILPWHPVALAVTVVLFPVALVLLVRGLPDILRTQERERPPAGRSLAALLVFLVLMGAASVASGIGSHTYAVMGLVPILSLFVALGAERWRAPAWRWTASVLVALWIGTGAVNLITRSGTSKRQMNDHPEQIIARLQDLSHGEGALVITNDMVLTFEINRRRAHGAPNLTVASCWLDRIHGRPAGLHDDPMGFPWVFEIEHPDPEHDEVGRISYQALVEARGLIEAPRREDLGEDPDWKWKRRITGAAVESARLWAWYGAPRPGDWQAIGRKLEEASRQSILADAPGPGGRP